MNYSLGTLIAFFSITILVSLFVYGFLTGNLKFGKFGGKNESESAMHSGLLRSLKRMGSFRDFEVLGKTTLNFGAESFTFDAIILGVFGTVAIKANYNSGDIYGDLRDEKWCCVNAEDKKSYFENPLPAINGSPKFFKEMYAAEKVKGGIADAFVVFPGRKSKLFVSKRVEAYTLDTVAEKLRSEKYEKDNGADISAMKAAITKHSV